MNITPGTVCILPNPLVEGATFTMEARSNIVNGAVQFHFADHFEWIPITGILGTVEV